MCVPNDEFSVLVCQILSKRCKYTTSMDMKKERKKKKSAIKSYSLMLYHMRAQCVCWRAENTALYESDQ